MTSNPCYRKDEAQARGTVRAAKAIIVALTCLAVSTSIAGTFAPAASLAQGRYYHSMTALANGKVLVAGGNRATSTGFAFVSTVELYDPATNTWSSAGSLTPALAYHTSTLLPNGKVLLAGGCEPAVAAPPQLYDPSTNSWSYAGAIVPPTRLFHTATLLPNGRVLLVGGIRTSGGPVIATADLFDPATSSWIAVPNMSHPRVDHAATLLPNGKVLVSGGRSAFSQFSGQRVADAELYDPATNTWSNAGTLTQGRDLHTATLLADGTVVVIGGVGPVFTGYSTINTSLNSAEVYDPAQNQWTRTSASECQLPGDTVVPGCMAEERETHIGIRLQDGNVLVAGGVGLSSAEVYVPAARQFVATGSMTTPRELHRAVLLPSGKPLIVGGWDAITGGRTLATTEIYTAVPATVPGPPVIGVATAGNTQATTTFGPPASNGGSPVTSYTVTSIPAGGVDANAGSIALQHVITGLTNGVSYRFTVTATNAVGTSGPSAASNAITPGPNAPAICAGFNDVTSSDQLCRNVEWLRNRAITLGCTAITFCPNDSVLRLQMAAFMNRLGTVLTPVELKVESMPGPFTPGAAAVMCQTADYTPTGRPARARAVGVLMGTASAPIGITLEAVQSTNGGVTWTPIALGTKDTLHPGRWNGMRALGSVALNANQTSRYGLRVLRTSGTVDLADSRCLLRVTIENRDGSAPPYDVE